jgi:hypothetical protein
MNERNLPPLRRLLVTPSGSRPSPADLAALMRRLRVDQRWSAAAVEQLIRAAAAADRWLATHPEEAARLVEDPAGAVAAIQQAGLLTEPVDDLLAVLQALGRHAAAKGGPRRAADPATVRAGAPPPLRARYRRASDPRGAKRGSRPTRADEAGR